MALLFGYIFIPETRRLELEDIGEDVALVSTGAAEKNMVHKETSI